ncbi:MAG: YitT family protein [Clostridia bacterium]|nr:YitT family protein [Clostridia bacterium]
MEENKVTEPLNETLPPKITKENIDPNAGTTKGVISAWLRSVVYVLASSLLIAIAVYAFIEPNEFTIGGITGIALTIFDSTREKVAISVLSFCLNVPLIVLSFFFVKRKFAILSSLNILLQSFWMFIMEEAFPHFQVVFPGGEAAKIFAAVAAALCIGAALALAFKSGGSTGGGDILAVIFQKKFKATSIAWVLFAMNCTIIVGYVVITHMTVFPLPKTDGKIDYGMLLLPIVLSAFEQYIESRTNEAITNGFQSATEFRIITDKPEEMSAALMKELSRGVTALPATGMYTKKGHTMILCVVSRRQVPTLKKVMKQVDPESFAVMAKVSQVLGLGFYSTEM